MLHRITWIAVPVVGLVLLGTGWWGYDQSRQRQALAAQAESQYESGFHDLATHVTQLHETLGKTLVTADPHGFLSEIRDTWRMSFAAQSDISRLPFELMPMHNTQSFLSQLSRNTDQWLRSDANPKDPKVAASLQKYYQESGAIGDKLSRMQDTLLDNRVPWSSVLTSIHSGKGDNQVVDGFRNIDTSAAAFTESRDKPTGLVRGRTNTLKDQSVVTAQQAIHAVSAFTGYQAGESWHATLSDKGAYDPVYIVDAELGGNRHLSASVSQHGGHVLEFQVDEQDSANTPQEDVERAQLSAEHWLTQRGFGHPGWQTTRQFDGTAYFTFAPIRQGSEVLAQTMTVRVSLANAQIIGFDGSNYYYHPVETNIAPRVYSTSALQRKLNPSFEVQMSKPVIVQDRNGVDVPAEAFYGTQNHQTYCVYMNAATGREMDIEQLS